MAVRRRQERRATAAQWTSVNPVLAAGEIGVQVEANGSVNRFKIGDGTKAWTALNFIEGGGHVRDSGWRFLDQPTKQFADSSGADGPEVQIGLRRIGNTVLYSISGDVSGNQAIIGAFPSGFRPVPVPTGDYYTLFANNDENTTYAGIIKPNGDFVTYAQLGICLISSNFVTEDPWPTTMPGAEITPPSALDPVSYEPLGLADTGLIYVGGDGNDAFGMSYQRIGNTVTAQAVDAIYLEAGSSNLYQQQIPLGFRPVGTIIADIPSQAKNAYVFFNEDGSARINNNGSTDSIEDGCTSATWVTVDPWPTLPLVVGTREVDQYTPPSVQPVQPIAGADSLRDTGWRDMGDPWQAAGTGQSLTVQIRRIGKQVTVAFQSDAGILGDYAMEMIPEGFRVSSNTPTDRPQNFVVYATQPTNDYTALRLIVGVAGDFGGFYSLEGSGEGPYYMDNGIISYITDDEWPAVLPGTSFP